MTETGLVGRRERKKRRTREALVEAALDLFMAKGFEATTVEEIADAVDVSSRTFFRYFSSKEEVALTLQTEQFEMLLAALAARPADEPVFTALRHAGAETIRACEEGGEAQRQRFECLLTLTAESPTLLARSLEQTQKKQIHLTEAVAARMGVEPDRDLRPHVLAAVALAAVHAAGEAMQRPQPLYPTFHEAVEAALRIAEEGVNFPPADPA